MEIPLAMDNRCQDSPQYSPQSQIVGEIEDNIRCVDAYSDVGGSAERFIITIVVPQILR